MTELRNMLLSASMLVMFATLARSFECPEQCVCAEQVKDREYACELPSGTVTITIAVNKYLKINCENGTFRSSELPNITITRNAPLQSLVVTGCALVEPLANMLAAFAVNSVEMVTVQHARGELTQEYVQGIEGVPVFRMFDADDQLTIPYSLLPSLHSLREFRLVGGHVSLLPGGFSNMSATLRYLELGNDSIEELPPNAFRGLTHVKDLSLWGNRIQNVTADSFRGLDSVEILDLGRNRLRQLPTGAFRFAPNLKAIQFYVNALQEVSTNAFEGLPHLEKISAFDNLAPLHLQPGSFCNLTITSLSLPRCKISGLPADVFHGSRQLLAINLTDNNIEELPSGVFKDQALVEELKLGGNRVGKLPKDVFSGLRKLKMLILDGNLIEELPGQLFSGLIYLTEVSICKNRLKHISPFAFHGVPYLRVLKLNDNAITFNVQTISTDTSQSTSKTNVSNSTSHISNSTSDISNSTNSSNLLSKDDVSHLLSNEEISLPSNSTSAVSLPSNIASDLSNLSMMTSIDLLDDWYEPVGQFSPFSFLPTLEELWLANNQVTQLYYDWQILMTELKILDLSGNDITEIQSLQFLSDVIVVNLTNNKISSIAMSYSPPGYQDDQRSHTEGLIILDGNPLVCDCHIYPLMLRSRGLWPTITREPLIQIGNARCAAPSKLANKLVKDLPEAAVTCPITCAPDCTCLVRPATSHLEVNCSTLPSNLHIPEDVTTVKTVLRLQVPPTSLIDLPDTVSVLHLDGIGLNEAPNSAPSTLRELDLSRNKLSRVPIALLTANLSLHLAGNPFICDCANYDFVFALRNSLLDLEKVKDQSDVTCADGQSPLAIDVTRLCTVRLAAWLGGLLAALGVLVAIAAALTYRYSLEIKVFMYSREWLRWMIREDDVDKDKKYDAFVSYSHQDERFVVEKIVYELENGPRPFKLCVHYRDWILGEWIPAQIANSVEQSRRTIIVLSKHFLESVWGTLEFRVAHLRAQKERRTRLVIILLEDTPPEDTLDPELRSYLSTNTYVKWGDPWFWEKLRYALSGCRVDEKTEKRARSLGEKIAKSGLHERLATHGGIVKNQNGKVASDLPS